MRNDVQLDGGGGNIQNKLNGNIFTFCINKALSAFIGFHNMVIAMRNRSTDTWEHQVNIKASHAL